LEAINGIHHCTQLAVVEGSGTKNNGYWMMAILDAGTIRITGFRQQ